MSEMHFNISIWPIVLAVVLGGLSTMLFGVGLMVMYLLFQRKREVVVETASPPVAVPTRSAYATR
jgi:hypothetical protein